MKVVDINNIPDNAVLARSVINDNGVVLNEHKVFLYMYLDITFFWFLFVV